MQCYSIYKGVLHIPLHSPPLIRTPPLHCSNSILDGQSRERMQAQENVLLNRQNGEHKLTHVIVSLSLRTYW